MKKIIFALLMLIPVNVFAYELKCDRYSARYNDEFTCYLEKEDYSGEGTMVYNSLTGQLKYSSNISCQVENSNEKLIGTFVEDKILYKGEVSNKRIIGFKCKVEEKIEKNTSVNLILDNFSYETGNGDKESDLVLRSGLINLVPEVTTTTTSKPKNINNSNTLLSSIEDDNLDLNFSRFVTEYDVSVKFEVERLDLRINPNNSNSKISIRGSQKLALGKNVIDIYVTAPDGSATTVYTLNINRLARGENIYYEKDDATLSGLTITGVNFIYDKDVTEYTINVGSDVEKLEIHPVTNYQDATFVINGDKNIKNGSIIAITVTSASKKNILKYTIKVNKAAPKKNYLITIIVAVVFIFIIGLIVLIVNLNNKNKSDPIINVKYDKRKLNKGNSINADDIPSVEVNNQTNTQVEMAQPSAPVEMVQPNAPVEMAQPSAPVEMVQPNAPVEMTQPSAPVEMVQPNAPVEMTQQTQSYDEQNVQNMGNNNQQ